MKNKSKKKGMKFEEIVLKDLIRNSDSIGDIKKGKINKTINSGSLWFDKGDMKTNEYVIEAKFTEKKGFRITLIMLKKLWKEAMEANKLPALVIGIQDGKDLWTIKAIVEKTRRN